MSKVSYWVWGSTFCADSYFGTRSIPVLPQWHVKDPGHCTKKCRWQFKAIKHTCAMYVALSKTVNWCMVIFGPVQKSCKLVKVFSLWIFDRQIIYQVKVDPSTLKFSVTSKKFISVFMITSHFFLFFCFVCLLFFVCLIVCWFLFVCLCVVLGFCGVGGWGVFFVCWFYIVSRMKLEKRSNENPPGIGICVWNILLFISWT